MFIVNSYTLAIIFCFITMICWGSWGNTQKLASKNWRYELYYWDYTIGIFLSNFLFNTVVMKRPFVGTPVSYKEYFAGKASTHLVGILGGCIWGLGTALSYIAAEKAGAAISYALGQGAPMIAALWGVFIWKEFTGSSKSTDRLLGIMFILFITGLSFIVLSGGN